MNYFKAHGLQSLLEFHFPRPAVIQPNCRFATFLASATFRGQRLACRGRLIPSQTLNVSPGRPRLRTFFYLCHLQTVSIPATPPPFFSEAKPGPQITGNSITHHIRQQATHPTPTNNSSDTKMVCTQHMGEVMNPLSEPSPLLKRCCFFFYPFTHRLYKHKPYICSSF